MLKSLAQEADAANAASIPASVLLQDGSAFDISTSRKGRPTPKVILMGIKRTKKAAAADKTSVKKRTLNATNTGQPASGAPFSEQDPKRRAGNFVGKGEFPRGGVRGK